MISVETGSVCFLFRPSCLLPSWHSEIQFSALHFHFNCFNLVLANSSVGYVPLLLVTEYKFLRQFFFTCLEKHDLWQVITVTSGTLCNQERQISIMSSWLIKCVLKKDMYRTFWCILAHIFLRFSKFSSGLTTYHCLLLHSNIMQHQLVTGVRQPTTTDSMPCRSVICKVSMIARTAGLSAPLPTKLLKSMVEHAQAAVFFSFSAAISFS